MIFEAGVFRAELKSGELQLEDSPWLSKFLKQISPEELAALTQAVLHRRKFASKSSGWLCDLSGPTYKLWEQASDRAFEGDPRLLILSLELVIRLVLAPWDGSDAPEWVRELRECHVELLTLLRQVGQPRLTPIGTR